jgi:uroporphyrinogen decarboxylase
VLKNNLIIQAAKGEKTERTPVWLMRQAGRILPEYRAVRNKLKDFKQLVETPELAAEVTLQPVDILGVDAAIIFSDILVIPEAMGLPYKMIEKKGPYFEKTIQNKEDVDKLIIPNPEEKLNYVVEAIKITKNELNNRVPLIGFSGAPWTILAYMVEGSGSKTFSQARKMLYSEPELSHQLLDKITQSTIAYLKAQIKAGADMIQIFDSWAGILTHDLYNTFSLKYIERICNEINNEVPVTVFAKDAWFALKDISELKCNTVGLDWNTDISHARITCSGKTLQGNLDPCVLYADKKSVEKHTRKMLAEFGPDKHIANLGHGVYPDTPLDNVKLFINTIKQFSFEEITV